MIRYGLLVLGACVCIATGCSLEYAPVCGTDGITYPNECSLRNQASTNSGLSKASDGPCDGFDRRSLDEQEKTTEPATPFCPCTFEYNPFCGTDGVTYPNKCSFKCTANKKEGLRIKHKGECEDVEDKTEVSEECYCTDEYKPVCGIDGVTYPNECAAKCGDVDVDYEGECKSTRKARNTNDVCICTFEYNPVCGTDGKTYPNRCALNCEKRKQTNLEIKHTGQCQTRSKRSPLQSCPCTRELNPMCGSDGRTYSNPCVFRCAAKASNIQLKHPGECGRRNRRATKELLCPCPKNLRPVCASNGQTYDNPCLLECAAKTYGSDIEFVHEGYCDSNKKVVKTRDVDNKSGNELLCPCPKIKREVCATNGKTYANPCLLQCAAKSDRSIKYLHEGPCNGVGI